MTNPEGTPRLGSWLKLYASIVDSKAHYSDRNFRALIETYVLGVRSIPVRGQFPNRPGLERRIGVEEVAYLIEQGDLDEHPDGTITLHRWDEYQRGVLSTERTRAHRGNTVDKFPNGSGTVPEQDGNAGSLLSTSTSTSARDTTIEEGTTAVDARGNEFDPWDPIDAFYLTTGQFPPEGGKLRPWITDVASKGPTRQDFGIVFADEWKKNGLKVPETLRATEARLSKMGERARKAEEAEQRRKANRSIFETPMMREYREAVAANYDKPQNGNGTAVKGGPLTAIGDVLGSMQRPDRSLTVDRSPEAESAAAALLVQAQNGTTPPAPSEQSDSADNVPAEPGEPGPGRETTPDGQGSKRR